MTENKRFTLAYEKGNWWAVRDYDITLWKEEVISLLNELYEENEQLKQSNERFSKTVAEQIIIIKEYREENEQLKQENQELHKLNQEYINNLSDEKKETLSEMLNAILGDDGE